MKKIYLLASIIFLAAPLLIFGTEVSLAPVADSPIWEGSPGTNYGSATYGYWGYYNGCQRTLVKWDCTSITGTVVSAKLSWQCMQNNSGTGKMWACKVTASWVESTVTWATQPAHDETAASRLLDIDWDPALGPVTHDCTAEAKAIIQNWVTNPSQNFGVKLKKDPESGTTPRCYPYMKEASGYQPVKLIVTYYPTVIEPTSVGELKATFK
jgi:hypothetical protein